MKYAILLLFTVTAAFVCTYGQATPERDLEKEKQREREQAYNDSVDRLRNAGKTTMPIDPNERFRIYTTKIRPLYRKPTPAELTLMDPGDSLRRDLEEFLTEKYTGIVKMVADKGCEAKFNVNVASPHCEKYGLPGAGAAFSFRKASHWLRRLSDLGFDGERFITTPGELIHGILVNIGDVPISRVKATTEYATLAGFEPVADEDLADAFSGLLKKGIRDGERLYSSSLPVKKNTTFLLRSIAYRAEYFRTVEGVEYDEMEFDTRKDVIVAFRVVGFEPDESVIFAWKEFERKDSPRLKR